MKLEDIPKMAIAVLHRQLAFGHKPMPLSEDDKFVVACVAGVHMDFLSQPGFATTEPCGVAWTGWEFIVWTLTGLRGKQPRYYPYRER